MGQQRFDGAVVLREFSFRQQSMNLLMTDAVQDLGVFAALRAGHEVVSISLCLRNRAPAQRAVHR